MSVNKPGQLTDRLQSRHIGPHAKGLQLPGVTQTRGAPGMSGCR